MIVIHELLENKKGGIPYDVVPDEYFDTVPKGGNVDEWFATIEGRTGYLEFAEGDAFTSYYNLLLSKNKYVVVLDVHGDALTDNETMFFENVVEVFVDGVSQYKHKDD